MFGSYGLCQRAGRVGVDPQTNFIEKAGRVEKTVGGFNPQPSPTTKSLLETQKPPKCYLILVCKAASTVENHCFTKSPTVLFIRKRKSVMNNFINRFYYRS